MKEVFCKKCGNCEHIFDNTEKWFCINCNYINKVKIQKLGE